ncbi:response regulator [Dankookia rubra]|uniref:Response regulator n=1 Tax=Dankookia rubra TaxID=1442381 RepID=A0A4R5QDP8_9PROT|nr:response regulator [Dankookia rubra]TDH60758.1 response regulator [Dankookia rubra]
MVDVLLIDSHPLVRRLVADMLEDLGLRVLAATAGAAEAQALLAKDLPPPAVLIVAIRPAGSRNGDGLNGQAVAAEFRQRLIGSDDRATPQPLGIAYLGEHASAIGSNGLGPAEQFLSEPFGQGALARTVFAVVGREMPRWLAGRTRARPAMRT